ncbi:MAG: hypothetical protein ABI885_13070, partial [Gammaproteobacteria bacterium]
RENHGTHLLSCKDGRRPQFRLMPKYLENCHGEETICQFYLTYEHGRMLPNWGELLFTPLGEDPVPPLSQPLPPWSPEKDPEYSKVLNPVINALYSADTRLNRLEAMLPLYLDHSPISKRSLTIDRVRMVYLENAVKAPNPNLVLVVFSYLAGYRVAQNGAGSGPPSG